MELTITTDEKKQLDWAVNGINRIAQNVYNLINTFKYEVAYDRTLGLSGRFIDKPRDVVESQISSEIFELISVREPRATVKSVQISGVDEDGNIQVRVVIEV